MLDKMMALAKSQDICVLATASGNRPHCSLMSYVMDDDCREIYMVTSKRTKKYENLLKNPSVSILIDTREEDKASSRSSTRALTVTGEFRLVEDSSKRGFALSRLLDRHPHLKGFLEQPDIEVICVRIESFQLLDGLTDSYFERL